MWFKILSRTSGAASVDGPSRTLFFWLISAFLLTLLPHVTQMPSWLTVSILLATIVPGFRRRMEALAAAHDHLDRRRRALPAGRPSPCNSTPYWAATPGRPSWPAS